MTASVQHVGAAEVAGARISSPTPRQRPLLVAVLEAFDRYPYAPEKSFNFGYLLTMVARKK
jgi:hypothetical protein